MKKIQLSDHFTCSRISLFALPSIGMQLVDNTYQIADGFFISNYIEESAFESENLIFPPLLIVMSVGLMFGIGASALISMKLGQGDTKKANQMMSFIVAVLAGFSLLLSIMLYLFMPTIARLVGASEDMVSDCVIYGRMLALFMPLQILSMAFQPLLIAAERPFLGLVTTVSNAVANILLDWAFVAGFSWGMRGAAFATGIAWLLSAVIPLVYFFNPKHTLHFVYPRWDIFAVVHTVYNGASKMVDAVSYAAVALIFNLQLIRYIGTDGVGAYAVSEYVSGLFISVFYAISMSIVPVVGYHFGTGNKSELRSLRCNGLLLNCGFGVFMTALSFGLAEQILRIFVGYNSDLTTELGNVIPAHCTCQELHRVVVDSLCAACVIWC